MIETDFLVIGAGIAGASTAYQLAEHASVLLIEMENQPGYHTTGRSAAFYAETYGGPLIQPLTTASKAFYHNQPEGFSEQKILTSLGAIHIFTEDQRHIADSVYNEKKLALPDISMLTAADVCARVPCLDKTQVAGGIYDPDCGNLDVSALHEGYLKAAKKAGAELMLNAGLNKANYCDGYWHVETSKDSVRAKVLINSAGAWGDAVAELVGVESVGLKPLRRTLITVPNPEGMTFDAKGPVVLDIEENYYFKPEGHGYLVTPADETFSLPCDAQPEAEDVALAAHLFGKATGTDVQTVLSKWAGLRTFGKDLLPVIGFASDQPAFFWNVGQGGYGIQTVPAWSELVACLLLNRPMSDVLVSAGVRPEVYCPSRFL